MGVPLPPVEVYPRYSRARNSLLFINSRGYPPPAPHLWHQSLSVSPLAERGWGITVTSVFLGAALCNDHSDLTHVCRSRCGSIGAFCHEDLQERYKSHDYAELKVGLIHIDWRTVDPYNFLLKKVGKTNGQNGNCVHRVGVRKKRTLIANLQLKDNKNVESNV